MKISADVAIRLRSLRTCIQGGTLSAQEGLERAFELGYYSRRYDDAYAPMHAQWPPFNPAPMIDPLNGLTAIERVAVHHVLNTVAKGSKSRAARTLGIIRSKLYSREKESHATV